jgi:heptosyltransferase-2
MPDQHLVERYFESLKGLLENDDLGLDFFIPPGEAIVEKDIPASHQLGYIAIVIGGSFMNKEMPVLKWQEVCKAIEHPIILIGGKEDFNEGYQISNIDPIKIYNACGKFSLNESADLLRRSRVVVSHDTGLMHIAAALKKMVITVWGSTAASFGTGVYYGKQAGKKMLSENVQVHKLWCRPCTDTGLDHCPQGHFKCMRKISVEELVAKVSKALRQNQNSNSLTEG